MPRFWQTTVVGAVSILAQCERLSTASRSCAPMAIALVAVTLVPSLLALLAPVERLRRV